MTMRSPLARLAFIGCVFLFPRAALGRLIPLYYLVKSTPTSSPTSLPSYQPSLRPSSRPSPSPSSRPSSLPSFHPTSSPSYSPSSQPTMTTNPSPSPSSSHQPTISSQPSSSQPTYDPSSPFMKIYTSFMKSVGLSSSSSVGMWVPISLVVILACIFCGLFHFVRKLKCKQRAQDYNDEYENEQQPYEETDDLWTEAVDAVGEIGRELFGVFAPSRTSQSQLDEEQGSPTTPTRKQKASTAAPPRANRIDVYVASTVQSRPKQSLSSSAAEQEDAQILPTASPQSKDKGGDKYEVRHNDEEKRREKKKRRRRRRERSSEQKGQFWGQAMTGLRVVGDQTKEFAETTSKQIGDSASNAVTAVTSVGGTGIGLFGRNNSSNTSDSMGSSTTNDNDSSDSSSVSSDTSSGDESDSANKSHKSEDTSVWSGIH